MSFSLSVQTDIPLCSGFSPSRRDASHSSQSHFLPSVFTRRRRAPPPPPRCGLSCRRLLFVILYVGRLLTVVATADALFVSKCVAIKINGVSLPSGNRFFQHSTTAHNKPDCARSSTAPHSDLPRARRYIPLFPVIYARISSLAAVQCSPFSPSSSPSFPPRCVTTPLCTSTLQRH